MDGGRRSSRRVRVVTVEGGTTRTREDVVATEEPLEIRLETPQDRFPLAVTMRTPGHDFELAAGFLFSEGVVRTADDLRQLAYCTDVGEEQQYNTVTVRLDAEPAVAAAALVRHFVTSSACGVCGTETIEALARRGLTPVAESERVRPEVLLSLPRRLREQQRLFDATGGLHASGLFAPDGALVCLREDVGRHNALDKVVGWAVLNRRLPLAGHIALVSGRTSYELVQKAVAAGVSCLAGVSAPSSLAVELAQRFGLTLVGFLREDRFNVYAGEVGVD